MTYLVSLPRSFLLVFRLGLREFYGIAIVYLLIQHGAHPAFRYIPLLEEKLCQVRLAQHKRSPEQKLDSIEISLF
jgi:hypothetical protein